MKNTFYLTLKLLFILLLSLEASASSTLEAHTQELLESIRKAKTPEEMKSIMNAMPRKFHLNAGVLVEEDSSILQSEKQKTSSNFTRYNALMRQNICSVVTDTNAQDTIICAESKKGSQGDVRRKEAKDDNPKDLVWNGRIRRGENKYIDNIITMENRNLQAGKVKEQPWSGDYWSLSAGALAQRYAEEEFPSSWHSVNSYMTSEINRNISFEQNLLDLLSPAEKYDLLVGDTDYNLTKSQLNAGQKYAFDREGKEKSVEVWMGLCHGWAPAAMMSKRPIHTVEAISPNGLKIRFRPSDIKALSTLKWANGTTVKLKNNVIKHASNFIGGRCNKKESNDSILTDPHSGAVLDDKCFDTNPSAWHKSVVNQVGIMKSSFIIDATFDYEVWNQPVLSYKYSYFNPISMERVESYKAALVSMEDFRDKDKFRSSRMNKYTRRDKKPYYVLGVVMELSYMGETFSRVDDMVTKEQDNISTVTYIYDLELTKTGKILGGEWYSNLHPDFLWTPQENSFAWNSVDSYDSSNEYKPSQSMSPNRQRVAKQASRQGTVLRSIVDGLIEASNKEP